MTKRLRVLVPTALAAGAFLLAGCGQEDPATAAGAETTTADETTGETARQPSTAARSSWTPAPPTR